MNPKISIITVVYNGAKFIEPTINSVLNQSFSSYEYIIIDGASTDNTLEIVEPYKERIHRIISEPDKGVYDAMNKGLKFAKGEYILFLNAGDELANEVILFEIFNGEDYDLIYGETMILDKNKELLGTRSELTSRKLPVDLKKSDFLNGQVVSHQSFIPKKSLCKAYSLKYQCSSDIDWMLNIISGCKTIRKTKTPISKYLQGGISDTQLHRCWKERFFILLKHFNIGIVLWKHLIFAIRFLKIGAYKTNA